MAHNRNSLMVFVFGVFSDSVANPALHVAESTSPHSTRPFAIFAHIPKTITVQAENLSGQFIKAQRSATITLLVQVDFVFVFNHYHSLHT
jgi:hypothetical protein